MASLPMQFPAAAPRALPRAWGNARMVTRITLIFLFTFLCLVARLSLRPVRWWAPPWVDWRIREFIQKAWGRVTQRIMGIHVRVVGAEPSDPYFLVSNHLSYIDVIIFSGCVRCIFVAMKEMCDWPLIGYTVIQMQTLFIDRLKPRDAVRVNEAIRGYLAEGKSVLMFPEATTSTGDGVLPFRGALLDAPVRLQMPVHYATIEFHATRHCPNPAQVLCWADETPFGEHAGRVLRLRRIDATVTFAQAPIEPTTRRELALQLEDAVRAQLQANQAGRR